MAKAQAVGVVIAARSWRWLFKKKYLVLYRLIPPFGLAFPAGHIDGGEGPKRACWRETIEETGLRPFLGKIIFQGFIPGDCPKCEGGHEWWVYEAWALCTPRVMEPSKHRFVKFMSPREMRTYVNRGEVDPNWFSYILPALKII